MNISTFVVAQALPVNFLSWTAIVVWRLLEGLK
jgi:hypothetical protein